MLALYIFLAFASVAMAEDGNQQKGQQQRGQPMRGPSIQASPQSNMQGPSIQGASPQAPMRAAPTEVPRRAAPIETQRRGPAVEVPRGAVEAPRRMEAQRPQRRAAPQSEFDSTPSMSRIQRFRRQEQRGQAGGAARETGAARQDVQTFLQTRRGQIKNRPTLQTQQAVKNALPRQIESHRQAAVNVNTRIKRYRPNYNHTFNDTFFERHHYHPNYYHRGVNWWRPYPWVVINNFLGWGWSYPVYFDRGGYPIPISPDVGYAPGYTPGYDQDAGYAPAEEATGDWLSLGVFVAGRSEDDAAYSPMFVQLAIDKEGDLSGTYYNASSDQIHPLDGLVDRESQQAVWKVSDNPDSPIMTTGLYNLTQDVAQVQVHFSDGSEQSWVLVRIRS